MSRSSVPRSRGRIRAAAKLGDFRWESSLRTWLCGILVRRWREVCRARERRPQTVQFANADTTQRRRTFDQFIAAQRKQPAFRQSASLVLGAADPLQKSGDGPRGAKLADQVH